MSWNSKNHERMKADLDAHDVSDPKQVWDDGEMTPMPSPKAVMTTRTGMLGRIADAGDLGSGNPSPYDIEVQAEILAKSTEHPERDTIAVPGTAKQPKFL
jgi:hypothetical protein